MEIQIRNHHINYKNIKDKFYIANTELNHDVLVDSVERHDIFSIMRNNNYTLGDTALYKLFATTLDMPEWINELPKYCFFYAEIDHLHLPMSLKKINAWSFARLQTDELIIPHQVTEIPCSAFQSAEIKALYLPSLVNIDRDSFKEFKGIIYSFNKQDLIASGVDSDIIVDLVHPEEVFKAFKHKKMSDIHRIEKRMGIDLLPSNFYELLKKSQDYSDDLYLEKLNPRNMLNSQTLLTVTRLKVCVLDYIKFKDRMRSLVEENDLLKAYIKPEDVSNKVEVSLALRRQFFSKKIPCEKVSASTNLRECSRAKT